MRRPIFWLPLALVLGTCLLFPLFRAGHPPLSGTALAALLTATVLLSGYLFAVILQPEKF
jgi:K+-transporting ATPase KdpF subunit